MSKDSSLRNRFPSGKASTDYSKLTKEKTKFQRPLSTVQFVGVLGLMLLVFAAVIVIEKQLPKGLKIQDEKDNGDRFISERAYKFLMRLTELGPRVAGSPENDIKAVQLLKEEIGKVVKEAHENHRVEMDVQKVSGAFRLQFLDGLTVAYEDQINVVVKIGSKIESKHSLLINCHYDTVADSPGASDDGAGCAVMLEVLRVLSKSPKILRHNIIFLFNGGEENFMPASHGFITKHKWAKEVRAFINLEACGAGGREVLFQAGPNHPWILETYSEEVPYPYATSLAQEIFQSGVIPGDTDYRIFRDFGNVSGLDFAWSANGYVYHTTFDTIQQIPLGSLQRTGDNILALARGMAQGHQLSNVEEYRAGNLVFFDFLGAFVVRWPMHVADIINVTSVIFSLYSIYCNVLETEKHEVLKRRQYYNKLVNCIFAVFASWLLPVLASLTVAGILLSMGRTMSWYARPLWAFFIYVIPTLVVSLAVILFHAKKYNKDIQLHPWTVFQLYYDAYQIIFTVVLFCGILLRIRSSFIPLIWVVFVTIGNFAKSKFFLKWRGSKWLLMHVFLAGLPFVQCFYLIIGAIYLFIPIMGRAGAASHAEFLIAIMISLLFASLFSFAIPLILLVDKVERIFSLLNGVFLMSMALLILTPLGFPYSGEPGALAPQRYMLAHTKRVIHDSSGAVVKESSGYWIPNMDINSPHAVDRHVPEMTQAQLVLEDCTNYLYCGMPYFVPVLSMISKTHWVPAPEPKIVTPLNLTITGIEKQEGSAKVHLKIQGPAHMGVMISPSLGLSLTSWNLESRDPLEGPKWNGRDTYFIYYAYGLQEKPLYLTLDFTLPKGHEGPLMDLAVTTHFLFGPGKMTKELAQLIAQFPPWTAVTSWTATYESWII